MKTPGAGLLRTKKRAMAMAAAVALALAIAGLCFQPTTSSAASSLGHHHHLHHQLPDFSDAKLLQVQVVFR